MIQDGYDCLLSRYQDLNENRYPFDIRKVSVTRRAKDTTAYGKNVNETDPKPISHRTTKSNRLDNGCRILLTTVFGEYVQSLVLAVLGVGKPGFGRPDAADGQRSRSEGAIFGLLRAHGSAATITRGQQRRRCTGRSSIRGCGGGGSRQTT